MAKSSSKVDWGTAVDASETDKYRLVWRSYGAEKTGKNHFALSGPGPIAIHCMDILGLEGTVEKFRREKEIRLFKYRFNKNGDNSQSDASAIRDAFLENMEISRKLARTVQVDETEIWEVFRYAEFGDKSDAPKNYDKLNADYREWIHAFDDCDANLQLIQKVKEKWETVEQIDNNTGKKKSVGRPSGRMEPTGFKEAGYLVQANLRHFWDRERGFVVEVINCRQNMALAGKEFDHGALDFPTFAQLVFEDSSEGDWS
jgi:hypothetical protein